MEEKSKVLVGQVSGLDCFRRYDYFIAQRKDNYIKVHYDEWLEATDGRVLNLTSKSYIVKNINAGEIVNNFDLPLSIPSENNPLVQVPNPALTPLANDFNGFDNWFNFDAGALPGGTTIGAIFESAIDATLVGIPIGCKDGWIITQTN